MLCNMIASISPWRIAAMCLLHVYVLLERWPTSDWWQGHDSCRYVSLAVKALADGKLIHGYIVKTVKTRLVPDKYISNTFINMYARCESLHDACRVFDLMATCRVFDLMATRDAFSWVR